MERMLDLRPDARFALLVLVLQTTQAVGAQHSPLTRAQGHMPVDVRFLAMEQCVARADVGHFGGGADQSMPQSGVRIDSDMRFHAEVPLVAFLGLMHLGVTALGMVLSRGRRGNQGRIDDGAFAHQQALLGQMTVDHVEDLACQCMHLEQAPKLQQRRRIRGRFTRKVNADAASDRLAVVDHLLDAFVQPPEALLRQVHPQHTLQSDRRATAAIALRVERLELCDQRRLARHRFDLGQIPVTACQFLLRRVLKFGKARLHGRGSLCRGTGRIVADA